MLSPEELYGGLTWIGVEMTPQQARELADNIDRFSIFVFFFLGCVEQNGMVGF